MITRRGARIARCQGLLGNDFVINYSTLGIVPIPISVYPKGIGDEGNAFTPPPKGFTMARKFRTKYDSPAAMLVEKGVRKPGPGRPSKNQAALVAEARAKGVVFLNEQAPAPFTPAPVAEEAPASE